MFAVRICSSVLLRAPQFIKFSKDYMDLLVYLITDIFLHHIHVRVMEARKCLGMMGTQTV
jgi:hypothetical protein